MRKGQTALEYLMTYGWAILIVIVVVAALYSLGLTKPCRWVGTQISGMGEAAVSGVKVTTSQLTISLQRNKPGNILITGINITSSGKDITTGTLTATTLNSGSPATPFIQTINGLGGSSGDCYSIGVTIYYNDTSVSPQVTHQTMGTISGTIES